MTYSSKTIALCALVILLGIGWLSFQSTIRAGEDRRWVTHSHLVIEKLDQILIDITQAETSQRGYILTGDEKYLVPYEARLNQVHRNLQEFRELTFDNPVQQKAAQRLETLVEARLAGLKERMAIRKQEGLLAAAEAVATGDNGAELMNQIRNLLGEMENAEEQLLLQRSEIAAAGARRVQSIIVLGNALAIFFFAAAGFVIHKEGGRRSSAEQRLQHVNERLERRTVELSEMNQELESFSYSVAHDLRAPLRQIGGYSRILLQDYEPQLDADAKRYLEKVAEGSRKMGHLVDDLLSLSKIGRQELSVEATPLNSLVQQVMEDLAPERSGRDIEWQIGELFSAECDPGLMKQVFVNLLSNAVKYTRKREHAVI